MGSTIASGPDSTATFGIGTFNSAAGVRLDASGTIGNLIFSAGSGTGTWTLDNNGSAANILTMAVTAGTPTITVNNPSATISAVIAGTQGLLKNGTGILTLSGANTFTGGLTVDAGRVSIATDANLGAAGGSVTLTGGSTLATTPDATATYGTGRTLTIGTGGATLIAGGFSTHTYAYNIIGSGALTLNAASTQITLSGSNSNSGGINVIGGRIRFNTANALPSTGLVNIQNGGVVVAGAFGTVAGWLGSGRIDTSSTGALLLAANSSEAIDMTGYANLMLGASTALTYSGTSFIPSSGIYRLGGGGQAGIFTLSANNVLTGAGSSLVVGNGSSAGYSQILLSGANDFGAGTTVTAGSRLIISNGGALGSGTATVNTGELQLRNSVTVNNALVLNGDPAGTSNLGLGALRANSGSNTWAGNITLASASRISADNTAGVSLTLGNIALGANGINFQTGGPVGGNIIVSGSLTGTGGLTKGGSGSGSSLGTGLLTLLSANTGWTGNTTVNYGVIAVGNDAALGSGTIAFNPTTSGGTVGIQSADASTRTLANAFGNFAGTNAIYSFGDAAGTTGNLVFTNATSASLGTNAPRTFQVNNKTSFANGFTGAGTTSLTKTGTGTMVMNGASTYTGTTRVSVGTLVVNGSLASTGTVSVASGARLGGTGSVGVVSSAGTVDPGDGGAGILKATSLSSVVSANSGFNFEFTTAGAPIWSDAAASGNDVFRLTSATPINFTMTAANQINIYLAANGTFLGGFFTDTNANFTNLIQNATFNVYMANAGGGTVYDGTAYSLLTNSDYSWSVVQVASADFAGGTVTDGWTMQVIAVPEPASLGLAGMGMMALLLFRRRSRVS